MSELAKRVVPLSLSSGERAGVRAGNITNYPIYFSNPVSQFRTPHSALRTRLAGFTLLELLVVIVIIGLLATIGLPAIRGMTKSNALIAANRQLLDDISYARQRAIADHTKVYMVFVPPNITDTTANGFPTTQGNYPYVDNLITNLYTGQYTTYALLALRSVGDQPGVSSPHYLTPWRTLPNGVYIATNKFYNLTNVGYAPPFARGISFPFPVATNINLSAYKLPYIAFNHLGQLDDGQEQYIPLARGSIFYTGDGSGNVTIDVVETPPGNAYYTGYASQNAQNNQVLPGAETNVVYNQIYIDPLTGRPRIQHQEVQ